MDHRGATRGAKNCPLCGEACADGVAAEDVSHFVLRCPSLAAERGAILRDMRAACRFRPLILVIDGSAGRDRDVVTLALALGGDLSARDGLDQFMLPTARAPASEAHPAVDRVAALRVSAPRLKAMAARRDVLLTQRATSGRLLWPAWALPAGVTCMAAAAPEALVAAPLVAPMIAAIMAQNDARAGPEPRRVA